MQKCVHTHTLRHVELVSSLESQIEVLPRCLEPTTMYKDTLHAARRHCMPGYATKHTHTHTYRERARHTHSHVCIQIETTQFHVTLCKRQIEKQR